ncbi:hypothetical protein [Acuticoccus sp. I52.16.1]|uniref:hypothetical protein n=1 Tax=Acuticoccus sp. I52.16.1 TaxID=2928472 RepID=UPI001FD48DAC|nr:hypothetical protein [Acuticoccus sp. I52.16.1]UOM35910.1 hypothetical protein MRB58_06855 [Acuticoccus sp. I52.16.1]
MTIRHTALAAVLALAPLAGPALAGEVGPSRAHPIDLGAVSGVAYYTVEPQGFRVVATLADGAEGTPLRVTSILAPGQSVVLSTPRIAGAVPVELVISREADTLLVHDTSIVTN